MVLMSWAVFKNIVLVQNVEGGGGGFYSQCEDVVVKFSDVG